jgi:hypothetical protein
MPWVRWDRAQTYEDMLADHGRPTPGEVATWADILTRARDRKLDDANVDASVVEPPAAS